MPNLTHARPGYSRALPGSNVRWEAGTARDYAGRRQYSEDTATNVYYEQMATRWGNWAKLFFNNKGVAAHGTDVCMNYPPNDPTVWDWT